MGHPRPLGDQEKNRTESLTLIQLCLFPERPMSFAPHVWKTLLPFRFFGVCFKTEFVTLSELREDLPGRFGLPEVTLPVFIMDSYNIAQYLEITFSSTAKSIYASAGNGAVEDTIAGRAHARFIEQWVDKCMAHEIRPCVLYTVRATQSDDKSKQHFLAKFGRVKLDELIAQNSDMTWKKEQYTRVRKQLGVLDLLLQERHERGEPGKFIAGTKPTHADFCIFAFYPYSLTNPELVRNTWRHPDLQYVSAWLDAMFDSSLVSRGELLPSNFIETEVLDGQ
ncbi:uncharacterized protein EV420DRAFT_1617800 [Desarmillaria tabescens]|uniref:Glutathione S-transferase UstS-like C-terminal domain-containing protein n=1 Tax=Armillaria tabescens TaxID=1929756 RepID=A0AA39T4Y5_ARMTA|nr:uncharacterized protein EV420DRAFT_1617800 [Desarmillaria tabescens]KAK0465011.1 hypothetical protein EV420DRAFT_1617800 [Desarmillaria tabescens]